jgi:arachidonate 15-lipoxygenase
MLSLLPCLPNDDRDATERAAQLGASRDTYRYSYAWPPGVAVAAEVPRADDYSVEYVAKILIINAQIFENMLPLADLFVSSGTLKAFLEDLLDELKGLSPHELGARFLHLHTELAAKMSALQPTSIEGYGRLYNSIAAPPAWAAWDEDRCFAWQRIAGVNPMLLSRVALIPAHVGIGQQHFARALGEGASLAAALAEGRVFACDYGLLAGAPGGVTEGRQKWLPAPYALFAAVEGELRAVAIQAGAAQGSPIYTPGDGYGWRLAKLAVQTADASYHEAIVHLGRTHMVMEAVALATRRQLAKRHPLSVLLTPHVEFTLPINNSAATNLVAPGGVIDQAFGATIEASAALVRKGLDAHALSSSSIVDDLAARGLDDPRVIAEHPYRDDGLLVWAAIRRFVGSYVARYYASDDAVVADAEVAAWVAELGAADGGRLAGVRAVRTVDELAQLVAIVIWTGSAQHSAVNFPQFPYMGVVPNIVGALWSAWPGPGIPDDAETHLKLLPPFRMAMLQFTTVYQLSALRMNRLGDYPLLHFLDTGVHPLLEAFRAELKAAEAVIAERDRARYLPYPHLLPSTIPASIHI